MLLILLDYLQGFGFVVPSVFFNASTRMILAAITSLLITIFLGPMFIKKLYELKIGQTIRSKEVCPHLAMLHEKKKDTPTMGGVLILFSMTISLFLWMDLKSSFTLLLFFITITMGTIGAIDDYLKLKHKNSKGLRAKFKFLMQFVTALIVAAYLLCPSFSASISKGKVFKSPTAKENVSYTIKKKANFKTLSTKEYISRVYIPFYKKPLFALSGFFVIFAFFFIIFIITGSANAVNLTDGLDGLASGCLIMVSSVLALFAFLSSNIEMAKYLNILYIDGSQEIAIYLLSLSGGALGFLWYNGYPAQIFMGDTGALSMGGILGLSAILIKREILLAIIGGIFVAEAISVILQVLSYKYRNKKRIFLCAPLHHHYEYKGWAETKVVLRFWIVGLLLAIIGVATIKFQ
jgi:phospho-N-acetylmuramoyl-pentapeptide-transferase